MHRTINIKGDIFFRFSERKVLRKIFGLVLESGCWRRHKNCEIDQIYDEYDVKFVKLARLRWVLDVMRMENIYLAKKVLCTKPGENGDRRRGRPKLRWCDELEENFAQVGCRNWRTNAQSREKWQKLMEEVKSHPGM